MNIHRSLLYQDLTSASRDAVYCALSFLKQHGYAASAPAQTPDAEREAFLLWLFTSPHQTELIQNYPDFQQRWSPIFPD